MLNKENNLRLKKVIKSFRQDSSNSISHLYETATFNSGPLNGKIITVKDLYATIDAPTQASSKILEGFMTGYDATVVTKLKKAGAAIVAKTHMDELALGGTGLHSAWGVINNPLDRYRMPGGSSSGAVNTFTSDIFTALGSDTGNSVRLPAAFCGVVGFKPSYGAVSRYGVFAFASSLDTVGWFNHNVTDAILTSQVLFGLDKRDLTSKLVSLPKVKKVKPTNVAFLNPFNKLSPSFNLAYQELINKFKLANIKVTIVTVEEELLNQIDTVYEIISYSEASSNDANLTGINFGQREQGKTWEDTVIKTRSHKLGLMVQRRFTLGAYYLMQENQIEIFNRAQKVRRILANTYNDIFDKFDLLLAPTTTVAPKWSEGKNKTWHSEYSTISNLIGCPSISLPFAYEDGLPLGILLDTKLYEDQKLLSYALYVEELINFNAINQSKGVKSDESI